MNYPDSLRERADVACRERVDVIGAEEFDQARSRDIDGGVAVGVTDEDDRLLLLRNEWSDGWLLPGGGVEPGEDWERAAVRETREETGVTARIDGPECLVRGVLEHAGTGERLVGHYVVFAATPTDGTAVADKPGAADEDIRDVAWFDAMPDSVHDREQVAPFFDG